MREYSSDVNFVRVSFQYFLLQFLLIRKRLIPQVNIVFQREREFSVDKICLGYSSIRQPLDEIFVGKQPFIVLIQKFREI